MTHNDFDFGSDIIEPIMNFMKKAEFKTGPTDHRKFIQFK